MFEHDLGAIVFYLNNNRVHSAPVLSRKYVDNKMEGSAHTEEQRRLFTPFGKGRTLYSTCHGIFDGKNVFATKEALLKSL